MINFKRYPHINDLLEHYINEMGEETIRNLINTGISSAEEAELFSRFVWVVVEKVHNDEEQGNVVLGGSDNTEMLPDLSYEVTNYMKAIGYYSIWEKISEAEM